MVKTNNGLKEVINVQDPDREYYERNGWTPSFDSDEKPAEEVKTPETDYIPRRGKRHHEE